MPSCHQAASASYPSVPPSLPGAFWRRVFKCKYPLWRTGFEGCYPIACFPPYDCIFGFWLQKPCHASCRPKAAGIQAARRLLLQYCRLLCCIAAAGDGRPHPHQPLSTTAAARDFLLPHQPVSTTAGARVACGHTRGKRRKGSRAAASTPHATRR